MADCEPDVMWQFARFSEGDIFGLSEMVQQNRLFQNVRCWVAASLGTSRQMTQLLDRGCSAAEEDSVASSVVLRDSGYQDLKCYVRKHYTLQGPPTLAVFLLQHSVLPEALVMVPLRNLKTDVVVHRWIACQRPQSVTGVARAHCCSPNRIDCFT